MAKTKKTERKDGEKMPKKSNSSIAKASNSDIQDLDERKKDKRVNKKHYWRHKPKDKVIVPPPSPKVH